MNDQTNGRGELRRVVAKLPLDIYTRLYACKIRTGLSLERLLEEGARLVIEKHRPIQDGDKRGAAS
jgi:hypothetical protein